MNRKRLGFRSATVGFCLMVLHLWACPGYGATFKLAWDANPETDLAGYRLHYGTASGNYPQVVDVGDVTGYEVVGLEDGVTYYFAVTAYNTAGNQSDYSNEVTARKNLAPQALASADPVSGPAPLRVSFTGSGLDSDGSITDYFWDFGDGNFSTAQHPVATYNTPGTYHAVLTVTDNDGATASSSLQIDVFGSNQPPVVTASADPSAGQAPLTVSFLGNGADPDGTIVAYHWDFGDGQSATSASTSHTYSSEGTYTAVLTVTDDDGATASNAVSIHVLSANEPPMVSVAATPTSGVPPLTVAFTCSAGDSDGTVVSYEWDFGDGGGSTDRNPTYTYNVEGTYTAAVTVTDDDGATASATVVIHLENLPPRANAGPDQKVDEGTTVLLDGSNSSDPDDGIASYLWVQISGPSVNLDDPHAMQPTFMAPAVSEQGISLSFRLTVEDFAGGNSTDTCIVNVSWVNMPPKADAGPDQTVDEKSTVILDGSRSSDPDDGVASYLWVQISGLSVNLDDPHAMQPSFSAPVVGVAGGALTFELTVTDRGGLQSTDTCIVNVSWVDMPPIADAGPDQVTEEGAIVALDGSKSTDPDDGIAAFHWTQTTGMPVTLFDADTPNASYIAPVVQRDGDVLTFKLNVRDRTGLQADDQCDVTVKAGDAAPKMHIADIAMEIQRKGPAYQARAFVTVVDESGSIVKDAVVAGVWTRNNQLINEIAQATTGNGAAKLDADKFLATRGDVVTLSILEVKTSGYTYDKAANVEGSDAIRVP
jgi:PKD repeat protein